MSKSAQYILGMCKDNRNDPDSPRELDSLLVSPGVNVNESHPNVEAIGRASKPFLRQRWHTAKGKRIIETLLQSKFSRESIEGNLGKCYGKFDLRGAPLSEMKLNQLDLSSIDFYAADLKRSNFYGSKLDGSFFSEADIRGARFDFALMEDVFLDRARYDRKTTFTGVDVRKINFNLAVLLQDQVRSQQRIEHLKSRHPFWAFLFFVTCDYGQSFPRFLAWAIGIILTFAGVFYAYPSIANVETPIDAIYFSAVTFSTLGFGDIVPETDFGKILVIVEVAFGYIMGGLLIAILVRRTIGN